MDYINLGRTGLKVSRICLGCMSYGVPPAGPLRPGSNLWSLNEEQSQPFFRQALDLGINFFDTANVYSCGDSERILGRFLKANAPPRRHRDRHQAQRRHARWPQRRRPLAQGDILRTRRIPAPPRHRLRRPLPGPSLGPHHPHRGDARRAQRPGARGQGALPRRIVHVGLAVLQGALSRRPPRLVALRHHAAPLQPALPRGGARDASALSRPGHRRACPGARWRAASWRVRGMRRRPSAPRPTATPSRSTPNRWRPTIALSTASASWPPRAEFRVRSLPWPGCSPGPQSPRPSSAQPSRIISQDAVAAVALKLSPDEIASLEGPYTPHPVLGLS